MPAVDVVVRGSVQGVGFRAFVLDLAERLEVEGEVWNRRDGSVEALARHENQSVLDEFVEALKGGPGRVTAVDSNLVQNYTASGFRVTQTR